MFPKKKAKLSCPRVLATFCTISSGSLGSFKLNIFQKCERIPVLPRVSAVQTIMPQTKEISRGPVRRRESKSTPLAYAPAEII